MDCGFDGAEWHHWKHHTYEGKAHPEVRKPLCTHIGRSADVYERQDDPETFDYATAISALKGKQ